MKDNPGIVIHLYRVMRWFYEHKLYLLAKIVCYLINYTPKLCDNLAKKSGNPADKWI